jgi:hypothetical protein
MRKIGMEEVMRWKGPDRELKRKLTGPLELKMTTTFLGRYIRNSDGLYTCRKHSEYLLKRQWRGVEELSGDGPEMRWE